LPVTKALPPSITPFLRVVEAEARFHATIRAAPEAAGSQRIGALALPVAMIDRRIFVVERCTGCIDQLEQAATVEVSTDGGGDDARSGRITAEISDGNRNAVGTSTGDFNGKLSLGNCCGQQRKSQENTAGKKLGIVFIFNKFARFYSSNGLYLISSVRWKRAGSSGLGKG
jgi:hypothetical protein